jgi:hypothetical protein
MRHHRAIFLAAAAGAAILLASCGAGEKFPVRTYAMGDKVTVGRLVYTVFETRWLPKLGEDPNARIPRQRFFLVRMSIVNGAGGEVLAPNLTIEDARGNSYGELSDGEGVPQWMGFLRRVRPADSAQGNVVFDVAPGRYKMRVMDESNERAALIDIPLSFISESPEIPETEKK